MLLLEYKSGMLTFKGYVKKDNRNEILAKCECGKDYSQPKSKFAKKHCISCGCYKKINFKNKLVKTATHRLTKTEIHRIWGSMKQRCSNPNDKSYNNYGFKGIKVCKEWESDFLKFYHWSLNNGYVVGLSIERKNNKLGYDENNCCWIPINSQHHTNGRNYRIIVDNTFYNLRQYSVLKGFDYDNLRTFAFRKNIDKEILEEEFLSQYLAKPRKKLLGRCND